MNSDNNITETRDEISARSEIQSDTSTIMIPIQRSTGSHR